MNPELWVREPGLAFLSWLPVPLGTLALWIALVPRFAARTFRVREGLLFFALTRIVFAALVVGVLGHRSTDWAGFVEQGRAALAGRLPYRDFFSLYAPGLPYLLGLSLAALPLGPLVLFVTADLGAWLALAARDGRVAMARSSAWAYLAFPPVWYFQARYAQDESIGALWVALALLALARGRRVAAGLALAGGQLCTKLLFALAALPIVLAPRAGTRLRLAYALPVLATYALLAAAGLPWMRNLAEQAVTFGQGPTLWNLPALWWGFDLGALAHVPAALLALIGWVRLWRRGAWPIELAAWLWGSYAVLAPKLLPMYVVLVAPALATWVALPPSRVEPAASIDRGAGREARVRLIWWGLYGFALSSAWYAESGPIQGLFGAWGRVLGSAVMLMVPALGVWLLARVWTRPSSA